MSIFGKSSQDYADSYTQISVAMDLFVLAKHSKGHAASNLAGESIPVQDISGTYALTLHGAVRQAFLIVPNTSIGNLDFRMAKAEEIKSLSISIIEYAIENTRGKSLTLDKFNATHTREEILYTLKKAKHYCLLQLSQAYEDKELAKSIRRT